MPQKGKLNLADMLTRQNPGQHQVEDRYRVVQVTGRNAEKRHVPQLTKLKEVAKVVNAEDMNDKDNVRNNRIETLLPTISQR